MGRNLPHRAAALERRAEQDGRECTDATRRYLQLRAERGRMAWQKATGYNRRALAEAAVGRYKRVTGGAVAVSDGSASRE